MDLLLVAQVIWHSSKISSMMIVVTIQILQTTQQLLVLQRGLHHAMGSSSMKNSK